MPRAKDPNKKTPSRQRKNPVVQTRMRQIRMEHHLTQGQMADLLGLSRQYYTCLERGLYDLTVDKILKLKQHFGVSADYILGYDPVGKVPVSTDELELIQTLHKISAPDVTKGILNMAKSIYYSFEKECVKRSLGNTAAGKDTTGK